MATVQRSGAGFDAFAHGKVPYIWNKSVIAVFATPLKDFLSTFPGIRVQDIDNALSTVGPERYFLAAFDTENPLNNRAVVSASYVLEQQKGNTKLTVAAKHLFPPGKRVQLLSGTQTWNIVSRFFSPNDPFLKELWSIIGTPDRRYENFFMPARTDERAPPEESKAVPKREPRLSSSEPPAEESKAVPKREHKLADPVTYHVAVDQMQVVIKRQQSKQVQFLTLDASKDLSREARSTLDPTCRPVYPIYQDDVFRVDVKVKNNTVVDTILVDVEPCRPVHNPIDLECYAIESVLSGDQQPLSTVVVDPSQPKWTSDTSLTVSPQQWKLLR